MNLLTKLITSMALAALPGSAQAGDTTTTLPVPDNATADAEQPPLILPLPTATEKKPRVILESLHADLADLNNLLAQDEQNLMLIKAKTAWVRKHITDLHNWITKQQPGNDSDPAYTRLRTLIGDMMDEVERDDMLDKFELQSLLVNHAQADFILNEMQRSQTTGDKPE